MLNPTWTPRELPVLEAIVRYRDDHPDTHGPTLNEIADMTGLDVETVHKATAALEEGFYIEVSKRMAPPGHWSIGGLSADARREVGQWPREQEYAARLIEALDSEAIEARDPEQRSKLVEAATILRTVGTDLLSGVISKVLTGATGLG